MLANSAINAPKADRRFMMAGVLSVLKGTRPDPLKLFSDLHDTYGDVVHFPIRPGAWVYLLSDPEDIRYVLVEGAAKFHKGPALKQNGNLGDGLLTSENELHKKQRKLVQPAFHGARIAAYAGVMVDYAQRLAGSWVNGWQSGQTYDMHHEMMTLTRDIVAKTLFDADVSSDGDAISKALELGIRETNRRIMSPLHAPDWIPTATNQKRREVQALLETTVQRMISTRRDSGEDKGDLLSMLLMAVDEEDGGQMTNQQVRDEAMTLFVAGHETTANALAWTWYLLAQHPTVETKLLEEINRALAGRKPTLADLTQLPYTEMIIKEALRLYPPAWVTSRLVMEDLTIHGYPIAKGSMLLISPYVLHHDARYFEAPAQFIPERWANDLEKRIPRYAYFPFGGGPRVCIGQMFAMMEARLILATLAQRWQMTLVSRQPVEMEPLITLRPKHAIQMRLTQRELIPM